MLCRVTHSADRAFEFAMPSVDGAFMRGSIDAYRAARHDDEAVEHNLARQRVREVERFIVGAASANDGYGTPKIWQLAGDAKLGRRVGEIVQGGRIVRTIRSH